MIEITNLNLSQKGQPSLSGISMRVPNGRIYGIFGLPHSGKSLLAAALAGAVAADEGSVRINGFDLATEPRQAKKALGYAPQGIGFPENATVYELLRFVADAKEIRADRRFIRVHEVMEAMGLEPMRDRIVARLSPSLLARLALAQACVGDPEILILDEPTEGLSIADRTALRELLLSLKEKGKTLFVFSSLATDLSAVADEVMLLDEGTLSRPVPTAELTRGEWVRLTVEGNTEAVLGLMEAHGTVLSCTVEPNGYRICTEKGAAAPLCIALREAGFGSPLTEPISASPAEQAWRDALCAELRTETKEDEQ